MPDTNLELMQKIHAQYADEISTACKATAIPAAFLAALVANESGGNPDAKRFEKSVLVALWEVLLERKANYAGLNRSRILAFLCGPILPDARKVTGADFVSHPLQRLDSLATSWGLTQIMGYHILDENLVPVPAVDPESMSTVNFSLLYTVALLERFAREFHLDERLEFVSLFCCWNTGEPRGKTFDPEYVPNGIARMKLYSSRYAFQR